MKIFFNRIFYKFILTLLTLVILIFHDLYSQKSYVKKINNLISESFIYTNNTSDGGWVTATSKIFFHAHQEKCGLLVIKYNKCSQVEWSKLYDFDNEYFTFSDICIDNNDNMMITGYNCFYDACKPVVIYLSSNGNLIWYKKLSSSLAKYVYSIGKTTDNNFFIFGMIADINGAMPCNFIVKFNAAGSVIWSYKYYDNPVWGEAVAVESNHILIRSGNLIYKVNGNGQVVWAKRFNGLHYSSKPIISNNSYTYINYPSAPNDTICYLFNINTSGLLTYTGSGFKGKNISRIKMLNNGNLIYTGGYKDYAGNEYVSLTEASQNGGILSQKIFNGISAADINRGCVLIMLSDNSFLITAKYNQSGEFYTIKTDNNHTFLCGETLVNNIFTAPNINVSTEFNYQSPINEIFTNANLNITNENLIDTSFCYFPDDMNLNLGNDTTLCAGTSLKLKSNITGNYTYLWSTGETNPEITVNTTGTYWLRVVGCDTVADTIKVNFTNGLSVKYKINPLICNLGESINFTNLTTSYTNYYWETGDGNQYQQNYFEHIYQNYGYYYPVIHFTDSNNCKYSDTAMVEVRFFIVYIPNSFTPDGNGINDVFDIKGEGIKLYHIYIYNRWGQQIFSESDMGWNGKFLDHYVKTGTYIYKVEITDIFNRLYIKNGTVNVIQ